MSCSICLENYNNNLCIPVICDPCGHGLCQTCLDSWKRQGRNTCPQCRQIINSSVINRSLIDILDNRVDNNTLNTGINNDSTNNANNDSTNNTTNN